MLAKLRWGYDRAYAAARRADEATIARSLEGNWRAEHLFALRQAIDTYDFNERQLGECDIAIDAQMARLKIQDAVPKKRAGARHRAMPRNSVRARAWRK